MRGAPRWRTGPVLGVLLVGGLLGGCASGSSGQPGSAPGNPAPPDLASPGTSSSSAPSGTPDASGGGQAVPVYYVVRTEAGARLYREFHWVPAGDPAAAALGELFARPTGTDPDYQSLWPAGWGARGPVEHTGGVLTVDLSAAATAGPSTPELSRLAVQQLVYTVQGALGSTDPVRILVDGRPGDRLWGQVRTDVPIGRADPFATRSLVQIDSPAQGPVLGRAVRVSGEAAVFEATVLWQVLQGPTVVQHGFATAAEAFRFSPYSFTVTLEPGEYTLRVYESDESGGEGRPPFADTKTITVR